ncbi:unnamed protein product [Closterium sp. NIES-54]
MVIVLEKELAALSMRPGDDVKPVLDKIKDTYARMATAGSNVSQMQQCTKIISVLDNSWDNLIPTLNTQQDQWTPEWLRQQIPQEDFRKRHTGGGVANKTAKWCRAARGSRGRGGGLGRGRGRGFGRRRGRGDYSEFKCFSRPEGWAPPSMKPPSGERARGGAVQGSGAQGDGAQGKADPEMFLMVEDVKGTEGDVGSVGKVVMHPLTHWVIDSGCTSHMTPRADLLDEVKPPGNIKFVAAASGALLPVIGVGNAKVMGANGGLVGLGNVLLVEGLSANLLSVCRLQKSKAKVTFGPASCRAKLGKLPLWDLEEKSSCIKDLWQLPIIHWNGKLLATAAAAATAKAIAGGEETAPSDGALDAVKKVQQPHGEVLAGVDAIAAWAKASSGSGEANWETYDVALNINTLGPRRLLAFAKQCRQPELLVHVSTVPVVVVRPSIVESALCEPMPGWIEGFRVLDPILMAYGKGAIPGFLSSPDGIYPSGSDLLSNAILAIAASNAKTPHMSSTSTFSPSPSPSASCTSSFTAACVPCDHFGCQPAVLHGLAAATTEHFAANPMKRKDGTPISVHPAILFPWLGLFMVIIWFQYRLPLLQWAAMLTKRHNHFRHLADIYLPYAFVNARFDSSNTDDLFTTMSPEERKMFDFNVHDINWNDYMCHVHIPGLRKKKRRKKHLRG